MVTKSEWAVGLVFVSVLALLPIAGHWRRDRSRRCDFDGAMIDAIYAVGVVEADGTRREFCCISCAEQWLQRAGRAPRTILVTDEIDGTAVEAAAAFFVRSPVVTNRRTGNRIHAFGVRADAAHYAAPLGSRLLDGADRPFRGE